MRKTPNSLLHLPHLIAVLLLGSALTTRADSVSLSFENPPSGTITNGTLVPVNVIAATSGAPVLASVTLNFRTLAPLCTNTWNAIAMATNVPPTNFVATIPRLPASNVEYYASCTYEDEGGPQTVSSVTNVYTVSGIMATVRQETFESGWTNYTNWGADNTGWWGTNTYVSSLSGVKPNTSSKFCYLFNWGSAGLSTNTQLMSPFFADGVANIYFEAVLRNTIGYAAEFDVEILTNGASSWEVLTNYTLSASLSGVTQAIPRKMYAPGRVRFVRTSFNAGDSGNNSAIVMDNLRISHPPADLQLAEPTNRITPTYPEAFNAVTIRCNAQDISTNEPTINRRMTLFYTWVSTNGASTNTASLAMTNAPGLPYEYSAVVSGLDAGTNSYYYRCDFDGYYYTNSDKRGPYYFSNSGLTSTNTIPTNRFSYVINDVNVRIIRLQPTEMAFGWCATNGVITNTLSICNDGNVPLTVSNVVCSGSGFSSSFTTNLFVLAKGSQNVSVVFQPTALGACAETVTVLSDMDSGTNSIPVTGTGMPIETVTTPAITGDTNGTLQQTLTFTASGASNSWGYPVEYRFNSSDGWTSDWSVATFSAVVTNHVWTNWANLGIFQVRAQARSATNYAVLSSWSEPPVSVTITNTAGINLLGDLNFGILGVNLTSNRFFTITNSGPGVLTVTNITISNGVFVSLATNIVLDPSTATNVSVRFAPVTPGYYTDLVVVASDATSGANTLLVTGVGEQVFIPTLLPVNTANTLYVANTFTALATNNTGEPLNFQFDWSDGSNLTWSASVPFGVTFTNTYTWNAPTNNCQVMVRARCATHTNNISGWSSPVSVTITNNRIMGLSPALLDFGSVVTNLTATRILIVTNSGNGSFTVDSISCPPNFSVTTNFTVQPGASVPVTITFAPLALGSYSGTVTVVSSDATSGGSNISVIGFCETISTPVLTNGLLAGHVNEVRPFGFGATSTAGHPIEYYYSWGDGAFTNWTAGAPVAHVWTSTNAFPLLVQARCQTHTNVISLWSATNLVRIYDPPTFAFSTITNGLPFRVTMTATGAAPSTVSNCVFYFIPPLSTNAQPTNMTNVITSTNDWTWTAMISPLNPGNIQYYLWYMRSGVLLRYPVSGALTTNTASNLGVWRQDAFQSGWVNAPGVTASNLFGWRGTNVWYGWLPNTSTDPNFPSLGSPVPNTPASRYLYLFNATNFVVISNSYLRIPASVEGIGAIYFEAVIRNSDASYNTSLMVQISTNGGSDWTDVSDNYVLTGSTVWRPQIVLNLRRPAMVQIVRTSFSDTDTANNTTIVLDNIRISPPPTDVQITESLMNPGYPNSKDPVRVRCWTSDYTNLSTGAIDAPSVNRQLSVIFRHETDATGRWFTNSMYATGSSSYEGVITNYPPGINAISYFFRCDFDGYYYSNSIYAGTAMNSWFLSERVSPSYSPDQRIGPIYSTYPRPDALPYGDTRPAIPQYTIRLFRSAHAEVLLTLTDVNGNRVSPSIDSLDTKTNFILVADYQWQGQTPMKGVTNLTWFFTGTLPYTNDASSFGSNDQWGVNSQEFPNPPIGGVADLGATNPWHVVIYYDGLLIYRFTTDSRACIVKRAVYQNFDDWQARPNYFEESSGIAAKIYLNDFQAWGTNYFNDGRVNPSAESRWKFENFNNQSLASDWNSSPLGTYNYWAYEQGMGKSDRDGNKAMMLNNDSSSLGRVFNTRNSLTEGIRKVTFRARLSQNDGRYAVFSRDLAGLDFTTNSWTNAYRLTNTISVASMTPGSAYISTLLCYHHNAMDLGTFYEFRLTQISDIALRLQLNRWNNGVLSQTIYQSGDVGGKLTDFSATTPLQVDIAWTNDIPTNGNPSVVRFAGRMSKGPTTLFTWATNTCYDDNDSKIWNGGVVGFVCADTEMAISALDVYSGTNLSVGKISETGFIPSSWYLGYTLDKPDCWTIAGGVLKRTVPTTPSYLALSTIRTGTTGLRDVEPSPTEIWSSEQSSPVSTFNYTNYSKTLNYWDQVYVNVACTNGTLPIVLDDLVVEPWRAYTRGIADSNWSGQATIGSVNFFDWTSTDQQADWALTMNGPDDWTIFEGLIVKTNGSISAQFDRSRANPSLWQGVWSPKLTNGMGSIRFRATLLGGSNTHFQVQRAFESNLKNWTVVEGGDFWITNSANDVFYYVPVLMGGVTGRLRIVQLGDSSPNAVLNIDDLDVRDYPPSATPWKAYNCLIASPLDASNTVGRSFSSPSIKSCYLNNSAHDDVFAPLTNDNAYIQTPVVETGIGEISFVYRSWTNTPTTTISIRGAPSENTPLGQWAQITNFTFSRNSYTNYQWVDAFYPQYKVMRIYQTTTTNLQPDNVTCRLCIDNILLAEPMRVGFDITSVTLLPLQPLATNQVGVCARAGRLLMNPQNIRLFLSYTFNTNVWGYANWWSPTPTAGVFTVELTNTNPADYTFTSTGTNFIPARGIDQVVQFVVWGTNDNMRGDPFFQGTNTFVNPSWYSPVNLNRDLAAQGWSPYYYVYSCPPYSVWVNEINYPYYQPDYDIGSYVELAGPANASIGNWQIELKDSLLNDLDSCFVTNTFKFVNVANGWGFFVWGDATVPNVNKLFSGDPNSMPSVGAVRLTRSMGAEEDLVCWVVDQDGYRNAGSKNWWVDGAPLGLAGGPGSNKLEFAWTQPSSGNYTPGAQNTDQTLANAPVIPLQFTYYYLTSIVGLHGTHSLPGSVVQVDAGATTSVTYTADSWYRMQEFTSNNSTNLSAAGTTQFVWAVTNVMQNITNNASFYLLPDGLNGRGVPTWWLASFGMPESLQQDFDIYGYADEYMLNMNPYVSNAVINFAVDAIAVTGATVNVTVKLLESTNGVDYYAQPNIYGTLYVLGTTNLQFGSFTNVMAFQVPTNVFDGNGRKVFSFPADTNTFYRAKIQ